MLHSANLIAFIAVTDPSRARAFYEDTLGLHLVSEGPFVCVFDSNGVQLRIQKVAELSPQPHTVLGWEVTDVRRTVAELLARGVGPERYPSIEQDDLGIWTAPSGARVAWFKDPDGNLLSITQGRTA